MFEQAFKNIDTVKAELKAKGKVSAQHYEATRQFCADRLIRTMDETAKAAQLAGLTPEKLAELLAHES